MNKILLRVFGGISLLSFLLCLLGFILYPISVLLLGLVVLIDGIILIRVSMELGFFTRVGKKEKDLK